MSNKEVIQFIPNLKPDKDTIKVDTIDFSTTSFYQLKTLLGDYDNIQYAKSYTRSCNNTVKAVTNVIKCLKADEQGYLEVYMNPGVFNSSDITKIFNQSHNMITMFTNDSKGQISLYQSDVESDRHVTQYKLWCEKIYVSEDLNFEPSTYNYQEEYSGDNTVQFQLLKGLLPVVYTKDQSYINIYKTITTLSNIETSKVVKFGHSLFNYVSMDKEFKDIGSQYKQQPILIIDKESSFIMNDVIKTDVTDYSKWLLNNTNYDYKSQDLRTRQIQSTYLINVLQNINYLPLIYQTMANSTTHIIKLVFKVKPNQVINIKLQKIYEVILAEDNFANLLQGITNKSLSQVQDQPVQDLSVVSLYDPCISLDKVYLKNLLKGFDIKGIFKTVADIAAPIANGFLPGLGPIINVACSTLLSSKFKQIDEEIIKLYNQQQDEDKDGYFKDNIKTIEKKIKELVQRRLQIQKEL